MICVGGVTIRLFLCADILALLLCTSTTIYVDSMNTAQYSIQLYLNLPYATQYSILVSSIPGTTVVVAVAVAKLKTLRLVS